MQYREWMDGERVSIQVCACLGVSHLLTALTFKMAATLLLSYIERVIVLTLKTPSRNAK